VFADYRRKKKLTGTVWSQKGTGKHKTNGLVGGGGNIPPLNGAGGNFPPSCAEKGDRRSGSFLTNQTTPVSTGGSNAKGEKGEGWGSFVWGGVAGSGSKCQKKGRTEKGGGSAKWGKPQWGPGQISRKRTSKSWGLLGGGKKLHQKVEKKGGAQKFSWCLKTLKPSANEGVQKKKKKAHTKKSKDQKGGTEEIASKRMAV